MSALIWGKEPTVQYVTSDQVNLSQPLRVPVAIYIASFVEWALMHGHARYSFCRPVLLAACLRKATTRLSQQAV